MRHTYLPPQQIHPKNLRGGSSPVCLSSFPDDPVILATTLPFELGQPELDTT